LTEIALSIIYLYRPGGPEFNLQTRRSSSITESASGLKEDVFQSLISMLIAIAWMNAQRLRNEWKALVLAWVVRKRYRRMKFDFVMDARLQHIVALIARSKIGEFLTVLLYLYWFTLQPRIV
jgi:hypothetical protein